MVVAFGCFIYAAVLNKNSPEVETIQTWTCKFKGKRPASTSTSVPSSISNHEFGRLCAESVSFQPTPPPLRRAVR